MSTIIGNEARMMAARVELQHDLLRKQWDLHNHDPSIRFKLLTAGLQCSISTCKKPVAKDKVKVCSACRAVIYCSPECAKRGWWNHKISCPALKSDREDKSLFTKLLAQFPWTNIGYAEGGDFCDLLLLLPFGLLGTTRDKVGYWALHVRGDSQLGDLKGFEAPWERLSEEDGWRLPKAQIPSLELSAPDATLPSFPPNFEETWTSYYEWRGLPITSPAALLLQWPMTVYACLKELGFDPCAAVSKPRRKLTVFYVGAREEICFIPLFGELALNFPNTDLDLVMFGPSAQMAVQLANCRGDAQSFRPCVFEYTALPACGQGTVRVFLDFDPEHEYYRPSRDPAEHPDAIVALNAGIGTYISWFHVVMLCCEFGIPFAVTDYSQGSLSQARMDLIEKAVNGTLPPAKTSEQTHQFAAMNQAVAESGIVDIETTCAALRIERAPKLNQFMQPNCKGSLSSLGAASGNAYIQVITPCPKA
ncbi:zinc finger MYND domain-containing protein 15 [Favolaschia claudopus]|uniref:Zinc finger MYND domain-containing protein 15 n=1 Tax=Favolaschia claudopus TaxID=2862362 RepID=A0AAW0D2K4_9AGAR